MQNNKENFIWLLEKFSDLKIMNYKISGFENLTLKQKELVYYLSQATLCGRDIFFDQNYKHNLLIRHTLEQLYIHFEGDRNSTNWNEFLVYLKRIWFSNGIHHHYSNDKFFPNCPKEYLLEILENSPKADFSKQKNIPDFNTFITDIIYNKNIAPKKLSKSGDDLVKNSAVNFYENISQKEVDDFYEKITVKNDDEPISYGLNSKIIKENGIVYEQIYKLNGLYSAAIEHIIFWLEKASSVAENENQKKHLLKLIEFYKTGNLKYWDEYCILWLKDTDSFIDYVNGFIENYDDPLNRKATWEAMVNFKDLEATKRTEIISQNAKWFEDNSPIDDIFKKKEIRGVSAKVITVAQIGGACFPSTPIGVNLPNADWIRKDYGSKSVTIDNITYAYDQASKGSGMLKEFAFSEEEIARTEKHGYIGGNIHTDLHECLGHGSGQLLPNVSADILKNYSSTLEEARADLFALYYMMDEKLIELKIIETLEVAKAEYDGYIRNGLLTQLVRVELEKDIEEDHMRNRQLIAQWCYEKGKQENIIERKEKNGKTYFTINDYDKLRTLFALLLKEVQRIKSTGDFEAGKKLVEDYGVKINLETHKEVLERFSKLNIAPYGGFVNPIITPEKENGKIIDFKVKYPESYSQQMLNYSKEFGFL